MLGRLKDFLVHSICECMSRLAYVNCGHSTCELRPCGLYTRRAAASCLGISASENPFHHAAIESKLCQIYQRVLFFLGSCVLDIV